MNILQPLYYIALIFSGAFSVFAQSPTRDACYKINCNAGRNSKTTSSGGNAVANYQTIGEYRTCGLNGIPFTINCDSKLSSFLNLKNCVARNVLPKKQCPPIATGKGYYPSGKGYMDMEDLPNGCKEEYKKKYYAVKNAIKDGKNGKSCG